MGLAHFKAVAFLFLKGVLCNKATIISLILTSIITIGLTYQYSSLIDMFLTQTNTDIVIDKSPVDLAPELLVNFATQYNLSHVDPGYLNSSGSAGLLSYFESSSSLPIKVLVISNESDDIALLEGAVFELPRTISSALFFSKYERCEALDVSLVTGIMTYATLPLLMNVYSAFSQHCAAPFSSLEGYTSLDTPPQYTISYYHLPKGPNLASAAAVSMLMAFSLFLIYPTNFYYSVYLFMTIARIDGRQLVMYFSGLTPLLYHGTMILCMSIPAIIVTVCGYAIAALRTQWKIVPFIVYIPTAILVPVYSAIVCDVLAIRFKSFESFRQLYNTFWMLMTYIPTVVLSFTKILLPGWMDPLFCVFPGYLHFKTTFIIESAALLRAGSKANDLVWFAFLDNGLAYCIIAMCIYSILFFILLMFYDRPYKAGFAGAKRGHARFLTSSDAGEKVDCAASLATSTSNESGSPGVPGYSGYMLNVGDTIRMVDRFVRTIMNTRQQRSDDASHDLRIPAVIIAHLSKTFNVRKTASYGLSCLRSKQAQDTGVSERPADCIHALTDVSLVFGKNSRSSSNITCIVGPNGCGKSTLFKSIIMAHKYDGGDIFINGVPVTSASRTELSKITKSISICLQDDAGIFETLTVKDNIKFYCNIAPSKSDSALTRYNNIIHRITNEGFLGLNEYLDTAAKSLSGGWKRRLSVMCSLCNEPDILILDEPTSGLDVLAREQLWRTIKSIAANRTVIVSTHNLEEADTYSSKIIFMWSGRVVSIGTAREIKHLCNERLCVSIRFSESISDETDPAEIVRVSLRQAVRESYSPNQGELFVEAAGSSTESNVRHFNALTKYLSVPIMFSTMLKLQQEKLIQDFTVSQPTLDQSFLELMQTAENCDD